MSMDATRTDRPEPPPLAKREGVHRSAPLSRMQQRLAFIQQLNPGQPLYQIPTAFRVKGALDVPVLERALAEMVKRHDVLRTTVHFGEQMATQVVGDLAIPLEKVDLRDRPADTRDRALMEMLQARANTPMDLEKGPLIQFLLVQMAEDDHVFFFMPHHIVWDGASLEIFHREIDQLYKAFQKDEPSPLRALPIQYGDFAAWHEEHHLRGPALEQQKAYWREKLAGELAPLALPTDRPRPPRMTYNGATAWWTLSAEETSALSEVGRQSGATLFMVLLGAYAALLHRWTQQTDLLVGTPVRGRLWAKTQRLIGFFVNTVILRLGVDPSATFEELLASLKNVARDAFEHQDMPLDVLVRELDVPRDTSRSPISQAFFAFRDERDVAPTLFGLPAVEIPMYADFETQDVTLWATQTNDGVVGALTYATDLFDRQTIERFLAQYKVLLSAIAKDPKQAVSAIDILPEAEKKQLAAWNDATRFDYPRDACAHELFAQRAAKQPDARALVFGDEALTYRELDARTNRLARHLRGLGVRRDSPVGLCVERSIDMIVAQLAILKAGGGYVPLDPAYPKDRLAFMAEDSEMPVIVTQASLEGDLPSHRAKVVRIDGDAAAIAQESDAPLEGGEKATPESLAYVIYTSGSTGKPKGVLVPHRAVTNLVCSTHREPGIGADDVLLAVTTLSFDIAVFDTLGALTAGATVVIAPREMAADGEALLATIRSQKVTFLNATPATWRLLVAAGWQGAERFTAICTGEAMPKDLAIELVKRVPAVWNGYGPTETTVWSTFWRTTAPVDRILIGRPVANTQIHVIDPRGRLCPIGVVGEILIGGDGVTHGYLKRHDLTAERFVVDPFRRDGARAYLTGDLGRYLPDGDVECLGRKDTQVKLRGFRIELGEIEAALASHPSVAHAVCSVREDEPGNPMLVAYVVPNAGASFTATELRKHLRGGLPQFMIPQHFVEMHELPLTPSGKVDRKKLPPPFGVAPAETEYVAPRTDQERVVAEACAELLKLPKVSMAENFFNLGGHSMLSLQLIAQLQKRTGVQLSPRVLLVNSLQQVAAMLPASASSSASGGAANESVRPAASPSTAPGGSRPSAPPDGGSIRQRLVDRVSKLLRRDR